ncbi:hypothetical protein EV714DRAFT_216324 [Schizophyllum commune]
MSVVPPVTFHERVDCPISGRNDMMSLGYLIDEEECEGDDAEVAMTEWTWGLPRGGLRSYLSSNHNQVFLRRDIMRMYATFEFILAPTFRTYLEVMEFAKHAGVIARDDEDISPRRPLTGLAPPSGLYRYVFIPFTDAARELQTEIGMQPQTDDDMNGGIHPIHESPAHDGSNEFPVVECHAHPYSVSSFAKQAFEYHRLGTYITAQWSTCVSFILLQWMWAKVEVPQWFLEAPKQSDGDWAVYGSEKSGYTLPPVNSVVRTTQDIEDILKIDHSDYPRPREKVLDWYPRLKPSRSGDLAVSRSLCFPRRSERLEKRSSLDAAGPRTARRRRKSSQATCTLRGAEEDSPPVWLQQNGHFPTELFSSTEWAFFCCGTCLDGKMGKKLSK